MSVRVKIPGIWRGLTNLEATVECQGETVLEVLLGLTWRYPGMHDRLFTAEGQPRRFVQVFLNQQPVREFTAPVAPGDELMLLIAIAGG